MQKHGFSLVELSIVLVILGLLTGGILAGQSLIRAAELRGVSRDIERYRSALYSFRDKYMAMPGDMANATRFWGDQATGTGSCADAAVTDGTPGTCNGDGNGMIGVISAARYEGFRYWQHLAMAGLIEGSYTGIAGPASADDAVPGTNVPAGRISNTGWVPEWLGPQDGSSLFYYAGNYGNQIRYGVTASGSWTNNPVMRPEEMWNIDTKIDDGRPAYGSIYTLKASSQANCSTSDTPASAEYALTQTSRTCTVFMKSGM